MRKNRLFKHLTVFIFFLLLAVTSTVMAEEAPERVFKPEELEQLLAPIALYPDALLAQVLTAATYPLEVVAADRFVKENQGLKSEALLEAAKDKDWDPSVKAMLEFPDLLAMMDEQLEWTEDLGNAFLTQQADCMDAVQRLRQKARQQGNLYTSDKQVIVVEPETQTIIIRPVRTEIVYVPVYDPWIIYGAWWYPGYPPYSFYPPRYYDTTFFSGVFVGVFWETWYCNWHSRDVYININHYNNFINRHYRKGDDQRFYKDGGDDQPWRYEPRNRRQAERRESLKVEQARTDFTEHKQDAVRIPVKDFKREVVGPAIKAREEASTNNKAEIKKQPAKEAREEVKVERNIKRQDRSDSRSREENPKSTKVQATDVKEIQSVRPSELVKEDIEQSSDDSRRNREDVRDITERGGARDRDTTIGHLPFERQNNPSFKTFQGPINRVGR